MARQIRAMNEGRPLPLVDLSSAFYEIVGFFEERLAAVQRHPPAEMHTNSCPPTIAAVRDAVKPTMARAPARGFAQRQVIEALEGYPEAARFLPAELGQPPAPKSQAFEAAAIAREGQDLREHFEERAGIIEHAGLPCPDAEFEAARITVTLARNRRYTWASLREALKGYPALASRLPATAGKRFHTLFFFFWRGHGPRARGRLRAQAGSLHRGADDEGMTPDPPERVPLYERFTLTYPASGTVILSFYPGGVPAPRAVFEAVEDSLVGVGSRA